MTKIYGWELGPVRIDRLGWGFWRLTVKPPGMVQPITTTFMATAAQAKRQFDAEVERHKPKPEERRRIWIAEETAKGVHKTGRHYGSYEECPRCEEIRESIRRDYR